MVNSITEENKKLVNKDRNSSIELLRIIAMVMIVFHHFAIHGGFSFSSTDISINHFWYNFILMGGKLGVDIFVLISGYFLVKDGRVEFNLKHIFKFIGQVLFYSLIAFLIFAILGNVSFNLDIIKKTFFPIIYGKWWFASVYFILYLLHPFINKILVNLNKNEYKILIGILLVCFSIIPTVFGTTFQGNNLIWFVCLYCVAGYIKLHGFSEKISTKQYFLLAITLIILTYLSSVVFVLLGTNWAIFRGHSTFFYSQEKLNILLIAVFLFIGFSRLKIKNKYINVIASATFGVYLIHDGNFVRNFLWNDVFKNATFQDSLMLIPYSILVSIGVYGICTLIDLLRQKTIEKVYMKILDKNIKTK